MPQYRMAYTLLTGPPKSPEQLSPDEGLTDHLVVHSILGTPGGGTTLSVQTFALGPKGHEPLDSFAAFVLATMLLGHAIEGDLGEGDKKLAVQALEILRKHGQRKR